MGRGIRPRSTAPPGVWVSVGHCGRNLEALREEEEEEMRAADQICVRHQTELFWKTAMRMETLA